ncbi:MAG: GNAT family N-acetyltransferase [Chitinophagales bacterium]|nr:GNAT family N-acetyltransferase [Chitinophagales bacterium]
MDIQIREAAQKDLPLVYELIYELAEFENTSQEHNVTLEQFIEDGIGSDPHYLSIVAESNDEICGMALYYLGYSTWKGKMMYLDDIVVKAKHRRNGIGKLLFQHLIQKAIEHEVNQLRWHVLDWNKSAIEFYKQFDASLDGEWITCKLEKEKLYL